MVTGERKTHAGVNIVFLLACWSGCGAIHFPTSAESAFSCLPVIRTHPNKGRADPWTPPTRSAMPDSDPGVLAGSHPDRGRDGGRAARSLSASKRQAPAMIVLPNIGTGTIQTHDRCEPDHPVNPIQLELTLADSTRNEIWTTKEIRA
jgi:hypothetical protein